MQRHTRQFTHIQILGIIDKKKYFLASIEPQVLILTWGFKSNQWVNDPNIMIKVRVSNENLSPLKVKQGKLFNFFEIYNEGPWCSETKFECDRLFSCFHWNSGTTPQPIGKIKSLKLLNIVNTMYIHKYFGNILKDINYVQIKYVFMYLNNLQFFTQPTTVTVGKLVLTWCVQHPLYFRGRLGGSRLPILKNYQQNGICNPLIEEFFQGLLMIILYDLLMPWKEIGVIMLIVFISAWKGAWPFIWVESPSPNDASLCHVLLKLAQWF